MALSKNMIAAAGEYLVCAELCRRNVLALMTPKNNPLFDVLATDPTGGRSVAIQVKTMATTNDQGWKFGKDLERDVGNPDMFVVLVDLHHSRSADFYIFRRNELSLRVRENYGRYIALPKRDGTPRVPTDFRWLDHADFSDDDRARKNAWHLLGFDMTSS